jgi:methionyl-tRNA synthetase
MRVFSRAGAVLKKFYITTPIYYVNDLPHLGHLYSTVVCDVAARFRRLRGDDVFFLTGTDEHGQKIERAAAEKGVSPKELADRVVSRYGDWWKTLEITNDDFIRTTEARHYRGVEALIARLREAGDLYRAPHEGWYCSGCEAYYTEKELLPGHLCPDHRTVCVWQSEENVFFRLSRYQEALLGFYATNPTFVAPASRFNEVKAFVSAGLKDLSVSRTSLSWGIPFPGESGHVVYVWLDALANYITALGFGADEDSRYRRYWVDPAAEKVHVVGKDILRFHAVYWPAFLMSAGLPLPTRICAHGWWLRDEKKMSKSVGNVVRPDELVEKFGPEALRYFFLREMSFGADANFSDEAFLERYNADLANGLGNAVSRVAQLCRNAFGGTPPEACAESDLRPGAERAATEFQEAFETFDFSRGLEAVNALLRETDAYIAARAPWKLLKAEGVTPELSRVLYACGEATRLAAAAVSPVMPTMASRAAEALGARPARSAEDLRWGGLPTGRPIPESPPLFPRADPREFFRQAEGGARVEGASAKISLEEFQKIELKTARILAAERVAKSKKLIRLEVDLGTEKRQLVAGIAERYAPEELVGRTVVVVANLAPARLMGVESDGMVLAASLESGQPVLLAPEESVPPGTRVK